MLLLGYHISSVSANISQGEGVNVVMYPVVYVSLEILCKSMSQS